MKNGSTSELYRRKNFDASYPLCAARIAGAVSPGNVRCGGLADSRAVRGIHRRVGSFYGKPDYAYRNRGHCRLIHGNHHFGRPADWGREAGGSGKGYRQRNMPLCSDSRRYDSGYDAFCKSYGLGNARASGSLLPDGFLCTDLFCRNGFYCSLQRIGKRFPGNRGFQNASYHRCHCLCA